MAKTYSLMGRYDQAKLLHLDGLQWHLAIGQDWQTIGYLWARSSYYPETVGGAKMAVTMLSMTYHHPESTPHFLQEVDELLPRFKEKLSAKDFEMAWEKGKGMDLDTAVSLFRSALQPNSQ